VGLAAVLVAAAVPGPAQQPGGVILDSNEALFGILAARVAAGMDPPSGSGTGAEARRFVGEYLGRKTLPVSGELRAAFAEAQGEAAAGSDLKPCVSMGLLMGPPPDYKPSAPQTSLPPDARKLQGLPPLLKSFYDQANLTDLWAQMQPHIQAEIDRQSPSIRRTIEISDVYLRFPSGAYLGRTYAIILSPLGPPEQVHARVYGQNYYLVVTPSREPKLEEIRHQYLHFLLDPLAFKYGLEIDKKSEVKAMARPAPLLPADFKEDFGLFIVESLIFAVELRLDKKPAAEAAKRLEELAAQGFILAPYFYAGLIEYEKQDSPMSLYLKEMIQKIEPLKEREKLLKITFAAKPAPTAEATPAPTPALSPEATLLLQGDNLVAEGKYLEARAAYRSVLDTHNAKNERALFGLGMVYSNTRKPGLAEEYFRKTLEVAEDLLLVTWAHIYLGRLYDIETDRKRALAEYQAAALTATAFPDAYRAVQDGLDRPFGFHK
jgi:tetratricopeptide (TPR) repeat protein